VILEVDVSKKTKVCTCCGATLPLGAFYKDKRTADGRMSRCKSCHLASKRASDLAHKGQREAYQAGYRRANCEALAAAAATRRAADPDREREKQSASRARRRDLINQRARERYRARKGQGQGDA